MSLHRAWMLSVGLPCLALAFTQFESLPLVFGSFVLFAQCSISFGTASVRRGKRGGEPDRFSVVGDGFIVAALLAVRYRCGKVILIQPDERKRIATRTQQP